MNNQINFHKPQPQFILINEQKPIINTQELHTKFNFIPQHQIQYNQHPIMRIQKIEDANEMARTQQNRIQHLEDCIDNLSRDYKRSLTNFDFKNKELEQQQLSYNNMQNNLNLHIQRVRQLEQNAEEIKEEHFQLMKACDIRENQYKQIQKIILEKTKELQQYIKNKDQENQIAEMEQKHHYIQIENKRLRRIKLEQSKIPLKHNQILTSSQPQFQSFPYQQGLNVNKY